MQRVTWLYTTVAWRVVCYIVCLPCYVVLGFVHFCSRVRGTTGKLLDSYTRPNHKKDTIMRLNHPTFLPCKSLNFISQFRPSYFYHLLYVYNLNFYFSTTCLVVPLFAVALSACYLIIYPALLHQFWTFYKLRARVGFLPDVSFPNFRHWILQRLRVGTRFNSFLVCPQVFDIFQYTWEA